MIQADPRGPPGRKRFKDLGLSSVAFQEYSEVSRWAMEVVSGLVIEVIGEDTMAGTREGTVEVRLLNPDTQGHLHFAQCRIFLM